MEGFNFSTEVTARFNETDAQGIIHHATHVAWFEIARISYLEQCSGGYAGLVASGVDVTTIEIYIRYRKSVKFNQKLLVWTRSGEIRGARLRFEYTITEALSDKVVAEGWTSHACVDASTLQARRIPNQLAQDLRSLALP